ncbi:site-specific integrase [Sphingomonas sp. BIUV-7]|uniref:Site-specific integrase n=1 Tax=Sphingomonas natans TaxID=3063330 RepID=A0ABT8YAW7_9SPHN|nr:site-specific integrase [Sphingomonas sp. BIUV-7]MDO6415461.1 site-specific integrase [Sphingomonas sp. BIUV-7]
MALWTRAGIYYVKLTAPDGTLLRRSTGTTDRTKAEEYHDKLKASLWDLARLKLKPKRTWDEAALRWLQEKAHKKSYRDDVSRIRWFTRHLRGKTLDQVSRDMIDGIVSRQLSKSSARTKDLYVALIRAMFRKAQREWEWIDQIPAFRTYSTDKSVRVRYLTQDQAKVLLERLPAHQREVVLFALATGLRQGNVLGLTWDRVDMTRRQATIEHGDTKNGDALGVPLNDVAMGVLGRQKGKNRVYVFTYRGDRLRSANNRAWRSALKACGITNFRWHDLRHTWASWLRQNDVPTWVLQELGGWKSESMVRRYAHMSAKHLQPYADKLIFPVTPEGSAQVVEKPAEPGFATGHKNGHSGGHFRLRLVAGTDVSS